MGGRFRQFVYGSDNEENQFVNPDDLLFSKTHEWVSIDDSQENKIATLGISAFAVEALTDLVYIELPQVGQEVEAEKPFCEVESVKAVSALETLGSDPYGEGWIAKIKLSSEAGLANLLDHAAYQKQCQED